ncbi:uncharacterized protein LOC142344020 isoform X2 [Convolutriloba macropyga]|uniref:uncharacterized protein LOC142344020 isoform X2 n=1 Tax=Convolutriloba macropyga TaxID=536237 RepID=UPI003F51C141
MFQVNKPGEYLKNSRLMKEAKTRGDVIIVNMSPNYHMLTVQLLIGYMWVHYSCPRVDYILKADDDTYMHLGAMDKLIKSVENRKPYHVAEVYAGQCYKNATVIRKGDKTPRSYQKWVVDRNTYGKDTFPRYCNGPAYFFSASLLPQIVTKCPYHCTGFPDNYHPDATTHWSDSQPITKQDFKDAPTQLAAPSNKHSFRSATNITNKPIRSSETTAKQPITSRNASQPIRNDSNCFWNWEDVFFGSCISTFENQPFTNFEGYGYFLGGMPRLKSLDRSKPYAAIHPVKRARSQLALHKYYANLTSGNLRAERVASVLANAKVV